MNNYYAPFQRPMGYYNPSIPNAQDFNNYAPQYQQAVPQAIQQSVPISAQASNDMVFVLNETEAMAYPVAPNNSVTLWDKNKDTVYIKANMQGVPSMRILDYTERITDNNAKSTASNSTKFVQIDEFNALRNKIDELQAELNDLTITRQNEVNNHEQ